MKFNPSKLKWACRRGMLELDIILNNFLEETFPKLQEEDQALFVELLNFPDPELYDLLITERNIEDKKIKKIVEVIRHHARSRIQR